MKKPNPEDSTLPPESLSVDGTSADGARALALIVLWCRDEPQRAGETLVVPEGQTWMFGRGDAAPDRHRLGLVRQRPGQRRATGPLGCARISREQILFRAEGDGQLSFVNEGRCPAILDGREIQTGSLRAGDILELRNEIVLLCAERPLEFPAFRGQELVTSMPFGAPDPFGLIGESPAAWALRLRMTQIARLGTHVLVLGPSGAGKERVARAIHAMSLRGKRALVARSAATIPEGIAEAELFGNLKSYPNPGTPDRAGLVGEADGTSLFLDEIGELPAPVQARLLRVLDEGEYQRLGESVSRRTDLRLIAATNRGPESLKHDVLARLRSRLIVPDLNERREDIPLLASHVLRRHAAVDPELGRFFPEGDLLAPARLSPALVIALVRHTFTTHVRELDRLVLQAALESGGKYVDLTRGVLSALEGTEAPPPRAIAPRSSAPANAPEDFFSPDEQRQLDLLRKHGFRATNAGRDPEYPGNRQTADLHLRKLICRALKHTGWRTSESVALLAGPSADADTRRRLASRFATFLDNLRSRLDANREGSSPEEAVASALSDEWAGSVGVLTETLRAIEAGLLS